MVETPIRAGRRAARPLKIGLVATVTAAVGLSVAVGFGIAVGNLSGPVNAGKVMLLLSGVVVLAAFRSRGFVGIGDAGPGVQLAALALSFAFLLGLLAEGDRLSGHHGTIALLFGLAVVAFLLGAASAVVLFGTRREPLTVGTGFDVLRHPLMVLVIGALLAIALLNLATGSIPLLSSNIDAARFTGNGGVLGRIWTWVIGGIEWVVVVAGIRGLVAGRIDRRTALVGAAGVGVLILLAGRSFLLIAGLALLVAVAGLQRLSLTRLVLVAVAGLLLLGVAGKARLNHSDQGGAVPQALQSQGTSSVFGLISQSAGTGPSVFATVLDEVPQVVPFQHGRFALRDFRATIPLHPFGRPQTADYWVTQALRGRDPAQIGGSPPTLVGGFYIDFGLPGIIIGSAALGVLLALLYAWALRARTVGALALYSYLAAYVALASYSYISIKPAVLTAVVLSLALHVVEKPARAAVGSRPEAVG